MSTSHWDPADEIVVTDRQVAVDVADEVVILGIDCGTYFAVEEVGAEIWRRVQSPISVESLCAELVRQYEVEPEVCATQVCTFLDRLIECGLIRRREAGS